jgi:hypothetical protein
MHHAKNNFSHTQFLRTRNIKIRIATMLLEPAPTHVSAFFPDRIEKLPGLPGENRFFIILHLVQNMNRITGTTASVEIRHCNHSSIPS